MSAPTMGDPILEGPTMSTPSVFNSISGTDNPTETLWPTITSMPSPMFFAPADVNPDDASPSVTGIGAPVLPPDNNYMASSSSPMNVHSNTNWNVNKNDSAFGAASKVTGNQNDFRSHTSGLGAGAISGIVVGALIGVGIGVFVFRKKFYNERETHWTHETSPVVLDNLQRGRSLS